MNQAEIIIEDLKGFLKAKYFYNPLLKVSSPNYIAMWRACNIAAPIKNKDNTKLRELVKSIRPISIFKGGILEKFGGYKRI